MEESTSWTHTFLEGITTFTMPSAATGISYRITVSRPAQTDPQQRFPLLIVLDGCMQFGSAVETARVQAMTGTAKNLIVVGVSTEGSLPAHNLRRLRDYAPPGLPADDPFWSDAIIGKVLKARLAAIGMTVEQGMGGAAEFRAFLLDELLPKLMTDLPIDADDLGLAGHSMGGLFSHYALLTQMPFHKYIMGSFSTELYGATLAALERDFSATPARQVFAGIGGAEIMPGMLNPEGMVNAQEVLTRLQNAHPESLHFAWRTFPDETHGSVMAQILASGVRMLWPSGVSYLEALPGRMGGKQE